MRNFNLLTDCLPPGVDMGGVCEFLRRFGFEARPAGELFEGARSEAEFLASIRIRDFEEPLDSPSRPSGEGVNGELRVISSRAADPRAAYDGFWFQREAHRICANSSRPGAANLVCTGRLLCTYGRGRYHARAVVMGAAPSVQAVSSEGVLEGPAKPPEYYWAKARMLQEGAADEKALAVLDEVFEGRFVKRSGGLLGRSVAAYCLQPLMYFFFGREFCADPQCSLFNSHRQSEVLAAQAKGRLCAGCEKVLKRGGVTLPSF